jgi:hypothetical protein
LRRRLPAVTATSYIDAGRFPVPGGGRPGLLVTGDGRSCEIVDGSFDVKSVYFGPHESIGGFWATFEQHCDEEEAALFGEIRYNTGVRLDLTAPLQVSTPPRRPLEFIVEARNFRDGRVHVSGWQLPPGATFRDNGDNTGTFSWTPRLDQLGTHLMRFVATSLDCDDVNVFTQVDVEYCSGVELAGRWLGLRHSCATGDRRRPHGTCSLRGTLRVSNLNLRASAAGTWVDLLLSDDETLGRDDVFLRRTWVRPLPGWSNTVVAVGAQLPPGLSAEGKYVLGVLDATNVESECDEAGNVLPRGPVAGNHSGGRQERSLRR